MPTIGHIGRYALKYQLGAGGLGTVFAAHDPLLSRLIAVKTLNVEIKESEREAFNSLFINEARAAGGLSHPHIVTVFDAGISDNRAYIAMELLKGRDLRQLRQEGWRATPAQAALIVRRVADALAFAHAKGVDPSRHQAGEQLMVGRTAAGARLRHRPHHPPARERRGDERRRLAVLHVAGAGARGAGGPAHRRVLARRRALRAADRRQALRRRLAEEHHPGGAGTTSRRWRARSTRPCRRRWPRSPPGRWPRTPNSVSVPPARSPATCASGWTPTRRGRRRSDGRYRAERRHPRTASQDALDRRRGAGDRRRVAGAALWSQDRPVCADPAPP